MDRRTFVAASTSALAFAVYPPRAPRIKAVLFDAFPIFDPRPVGAAVTHLFPEQGAALLAAWRTRQFEYTWLRATGMQYRDFLLTTGDALDAAAGSLRLKIPATQRAELLGQFLHLPVWPDVTAALDQLKAAGLRLGFLTNFTPAMLHSNLSAAGLAGRFDYLLSTDQARTFKPSPASYHLGLTGTGLQKGEIAFAAFAGWDAVGAAWFGYPTIWINRLDAPAESLGATPAREGPDLATLLAYLGVA